MWGRPQISFSSSWWVSTLPGCWARTCSKRYSFGVSVRRSSSIKTLRAARSIFSRSIRTMLAPEHDLGPRQQLGHAERLGDVVVGAELEQPHFLHLARLHRQDDDGNVRP